MNTAEESAALTGAHLRGPVELAGLVLLQLHFEKLARDTSADTSPSSPLNLTLAVAEVSASRAVIDVTFALRVEKAFDVTVAHRVVFRLPADRPQPDNIEDHWRQVAARLAPVVVYPYVREVVSSVTAKAGMAAATLPVLNVGAALDPATLNMPVLQPSE